MRLRYLVLVVSIFLYLLYPAWVFAQDPDDPGNPDSVWISLVPMYQTWNQFYDRPFGFAVVCSAYVDEYLAGMAIPISFYHSQNLDIIADSIKFSDWFTSIYPTVIGSTCHNDSIGSSSYSPKSFLAGGLWVNATQGQCFPPGREELFTVYFNGNHTGVPNWDTTKSIVLDSFFFHPPELPNGNLMIFTDTLPVNFNPVFRYGVIGDTVILSGVAYKSDGMVPEVGVSVYCRGKDVYRDTFYFPGRVLCDRTDGSGNFRFAVGKGGHWCVFRDTTGGLVPGTNAFCFDSLVTDETGLVFRGYLTRCEYPRHFVFSESTGSYYNIEIDSVSWLGMGMEECDEIGVFDDTGGGMLCVGASVYHTSALHTPLVAWEDDPLTPEKDGYLSGDGMHFILWSSDAHLEECALGHYSIGDGTFGSETYSQLWLEAPCVPPETFTVFIPDTFSNAGADICIPIVLSEDVTGKEIYSFQCCLTYDYGVLQADSCISYGTISETWGLPSCDISSGQVCLTLEGTTPLSGSGSLVFVCFLVTGSPQDTTTIHVASAEFNQGNPIASAQDGIFEVSPYYTISGQISQCPGGCWIDSALVGLTGGKLDSAYTDSDSGYYLLDSILYGQSYTIRPDKKNDQRSAISAFDASIVLRCVVGLLDCGPCSLLAGDVSCNGSLSAFDASLILRYVVGIIDTFNCGQDWRFIPADFDLDTSNWATAPDSIYHPSVTEDLDNQDFLGLLLGDVSGNWCTRGLSSKISGIAGEQSLALFPQKINVKPGEYLTVTVEVNNLPKRHSADLAFTYDRDVLDIKEIQTEDLTENCLLEKSCSDGLIRVALAGDQPFSGSGTILSLTFDAKQKIYLDHTEVELNRVKLDEVDYLPENKSIGVKFSECLEVKDFRLYQNSPNPFNLTTVIGFSIPRPSQVRVEVFNVLGQRVATLLDDYRDPGRYRIIWKGTDNEGNPVASGIYFYRLVTDETTDIKKMLLIK